MNIEELFTLSGTGLVIGALLSCSRLHLRLGGFRPVRLRLSPIHASRFHPEAKHFEFSVLPQRFLL